MPQSSETPTAILFDFEMLKHQITVGLQCEQNMPQEMKDLIRMIKENPSSRAAKQSEFSLRQMLLSDDVYNTTAMNEIIPVWKTNGKYIVGEKLSLDEKRGKMIQVVSIRQTQNAKEVGYLGIEDLRNAGVLESDPATRTYKRERDQWVHQEEDKKHVLLAPVTILDRLNRAAKNKFQPK